MNDDRLDNIETRWSLVRQAHISGAGASAAQANAVLVMRYASAIRRYVGGILQKHDDTEDIAQDVMVRLLKGDFANADPNRGRFRDLLKAAVRNMIRNHWAKQNRRQSSHVDFDRLADDRENESDAAWTTAWQTNVLDHAWSALKEVERAKPNNPAHTLLKWRAEFPDESSEQLAERLSAKLGSLVNPASARQMLRRARLRFAEFVVNEITLGLDDATPARIKEELAALGLLEYVRDFLPDDWESTGKLHNA